MKECLDQKCVGSLVPRFVWQWYWMGWTRWPFIRVCSWCGQPEGVKPRTDEDRERTKQAVYAELERRARTRAEGKQ